MSPTGESPAAARAIEDALALLADTGPEYHGDLSNHGPMAAEALVALGRTDAVVPWVTRYRKRLEGHPSGTRAIGGDWLEALGTRGRAGDWSAFFRRRVEEKPWREVVAEWVPRLAPGVLAAAFHGVLRTAHAVRSLARAETPARRRELAEGLAHWAATYQTLPETRTRGRTGRLPSSVLADVPELPQSARATAGNISDRLAPLGRFGPFADVAGLADAEGDPSAFLSDLTETFAGVFLATVPPGDLIVFVHALTGPSAVRLLLPYLDAEARAEALRHVWQGAAALHAAFSGKMPAPAAGHAKEKTPEPDDVVDRAIATGDEHAIKFTEACLREHAVSPKPLFLRAARRAVERFG